MSWISAIGLICDKLDIKVYQIEDFVLKSCKFQASKSGPSRQTISNPAYIL